jgi:hypothetical protein
MCLATGFDSVRPSGHNTFYTHMGRKSLLVDSLVHTKIVLNSECECSDDTPMAVRQLVCVCDRSLQAKGLSSSCVLHTVYCTNPTATVAGYDDKPACTLCLLQQLIP